MQLHRNISLIPVLVLVLFASNQTLALQLPNPAIKHKPGTNKEFRLASDKELLLNAKPELTPLSGIYTQRSLDGSGSRIADNNAGAAKATNFALISLGLVGLWVARRQQANRDLHNTGKSPSRERKKAP